MADCISRNISDVIVKSVEESGMFSILVDDTKDISKTEQMSIVLQYFDKYAKSVNECFIGFFQPDDLDAQSLVNCMTTALNNHSISFEKCIAQSYDE